MIKIMFFMSTIFFFISNMLILISSLISKKTIQDREKCSPFECGFDPKSLPRIPFSLHFFLITVIFLIFDVEIALIFPMIPSFSMTNMFIWFKTSIFFFIILLLGLYHEWNQKMLNWTY
uniref:NADH-ubiquinone oxidoreductase chain 3 n=1 Tax=Pieris brassicae TaxID=7116 RepID=A0A3S5GP03_PIEBR|nr:NADH dehydrogenase subunit 3 [Pieris brassicae]AXK15970.1 NADH dehydrogenase subunit 3 [Pieris brassicae]AXK15971.1 NADH dehydrogenase subunit 3 [Pieris brassicae]AXK15972.1 NADH dehydrogenase subunit 3 [Pieris brassicae]AXK15973.1 NADH dehydrogenase subunit 3 [Pieris brassicae]